jgi:flagellar biogenesis protein FliO
VFESGSREIPKTHQAHGASLGALFAWVWSQVRARSKERHLRLCETLSLGEKRFLAVVEYDREKFLLAGTAQSISLLRCLNGASGARGETAALETKPE